MFFILGGAPRCGKSIMARRFAEKFKIPYFATDFLVSALEGFSELNRLINDYVDNGIKTSGKNPGIHNIK